MATNSSEAKSIGFTVTVDEAYDILNKTASIAFDKNVEEKNYVKREQTAQIIGQLFDNLDVISTQSTVFQSLESPRIAVSELVDPVTQEFQIIVQEFLETHTGEELDRLNVDNDRLAALNAVSAYIAGAFAMRAFEQQPST